MHRQARFSPVPMKGMGRVGFRFTKACRDVRDRQRGRRTPASALSKSAWIEIECPYCFEKTLSSEYRPGDERNCFHCRRKFIHPGYGEKIGRKAQHEQAEG